MQPSGAILRWSYVHAGLVLLGLLFVWQQQPLFSLFAVGLLSFSYYVQALRPVAGNLWYSIGRANLLSLSRLLLLSVLLLFYTAVPAVAVAAILVMSLILDGIDGWVARNFHESSEFGHYLDVEIDAFGIAVLSCLLWRYESISGLVLLCGAMRYLYVWLVKLTINSQKLEPKRWYASVIAVLVYLSMAARLVFEHRLFAWVLWLSCGLLLASFARSFWFHWRD